MLTDVLLNFVPVFGQMVAVECVLFENTGFDESAAFV
jgi:hypothetical protein